MPYALGSGAFPFFQLPSTNQLQQQQQQQQAPQQLNQTR
jgi:hypothetical protein